MAIAFFIFFFCFPSCTSYIRSSTKIKTSNGISSLEEINLGGIKQWIFIRGTDQKNPVLIFLHGGPGEPALGMPSSRFLDKELIKHFTVVHWDQLGAGKSYNSTIPVNAMTFNRWIEDCDDLIDSMRSRFKTQKVFLAGHSGGTIVGIKTAHKYPEKIHAYIGVSQIVNYYEQQRISYHYILKEAEKSGNLKVQKAIQSIGPPPYDVHTKEKGLNFTRKSRYEEIKRINFTEEIKSLKTPVYFFHGKYDMIVPTVQVEEFFNNLIAEKGKKLIIFEHSAHLPIIEEKEKFNNLLKELALQVYQKK